MEIKTTPAALELHRQKTFEELPAKKEISLVFLYEYVSVTAWPARLAPR